MAGVHALGFVLLGSGALVALVGTVLGAGGAENPSSSRAWPRDPSVGERVAA